MSDNDGDKTLGLRLEPMSVKGRYFLFARTPPTVMMIDANTALVTRLLESFGDAAREQHTNLLAKQGIEASVADRRFDRALAALRGAGLDVLADL